MTPSKEEIAALVERVRGLKGPDAAVDAELYATIGGAPHTALAGERTVPLVRKGDPSDWPAYTGSVDAARDLVLRERPNAMMRVYDNPDDGSVCADIVDGLVYAKAAHDTWPIALTLALLLSLQSQEPTP